MHPASLTDDAKKKKVAELTRLFLHKHYCENDTELLLSHLDDAFSWFGAGEHEYAADPETVIRTFRTFAGKVPRCEIGEEQYDVIQPMPDMFICTGMLWVATAPDSGICLCAPAHHGRFPLDGAGAPLLPSPSFQSLQRDGYERQRLS